MFKDQNLSQKLTSNQNRDFHIVSGHVLTMKWFVVLIDSIRWRKSYALIRVKR